MGCGVHHWRHKLKTDVQGAQYPIITDHFDIKTMGIRSQVVFKRKGLSLSEFSSNRLTDIIKRSTKRDIELNKLKTLSSFKYSTNMEADTL